jgi:DNA-3-methyladenine glycosylase I
MSSYCDVAPGDPWHGPYHDAEYGFPLTGDAELFERLVLEINQAGLSWLTILKKREHFRRAYHDFEVERVARYGARDVRRLLGDAGIIRNRLKVALRSPTRRRSSRCASRVWRVPRLAAGAPSCLKAEWVGCSRTFRFTGEIVGSSC